MMHDQAMSFKTSLEGKTVNCSKQTSRSNSIHIQKYNKENVSQTACVCNLSQVSGKMAWNVSFLVIRKCYCAQISLILMKLSNMLGLLYFQNTMIQHFYCINTSYPMENSFTGRRDQSRQTSEKDVLYILPAGPVTECAFARWRIVLHFLFTY